MIKFKRLHEEMIVPTKGSSGSAGYDLYYFGEKAIELHQRFFKVVNLGFATEFDSGLVGLVCDRSGLGGKGIKVFGGIVDSDYRGEWKVILGNLGPHSVIINPRDRIAQVLFLPIVSQMFWVETNKLEKSDRGIGGFGSTGL